MIKSTGIINCKRLNHFFRLPLIRTKKANIYIWENLEVKLQKDAVDKVTRRGLIDELERVLNSLQESYLDVCFGGETEPDPSSGTKGLKEE